MEMLWWEKTVEYFFVQKYVDLKMFIAPLDGAHEKAGDAIFSNEKKWLLIEFKRNAKSIMEEESKFTDFPNAKKLLQAKDSHHLIIYGEAKNSNFQLMCQRYFSGITIDINHALESGTSKGSFLQYLHEFIRHKKGETGAGGYSFVAGVSSDGSITKCMKLSEFSEALNLEKEIVQKIAREQEPSRSYSEHSPGR